MLYILDTEKSVVKWPTYQPTNNQPKQINQLKPTKQPTNHPTNNPINQPPTHPSIIDAI
jgi:hypothetical protein